jgi:hypothetical protein
MFQGRRSRHTEGLGPGAADVLNIVGWTAACIARREEIRLTRSGHAGWSYRGRLLRWLKKLAHYLGHPT